MTQRKSQDVFKNILFSLIVLFLFFGITEVSCRAFHYIQVGHDQFYYDWFQWARLVGWHEPKPGVINQMGFHNKEISPIKPKGVFRILVLGSSAVYGTEELDSSWTYSLEKTLNQNAKGIQYQVLNGGIPGGSSNEDVKQLRAALELDPDLVLVYNGFNDSYAMHYSPEGYRNRAPKYGLKGDIKEFKNHLSRVSFAYVSFAHLLKPINDCIKSQRHKMKPEVQPDPQKSGKIFEHQSSDAPPPTKETAQKKKILRIWDQEYVYIIGQKQPMIHEFAVVYEKNLMEIHRILKKRHIPHVFFLQPNLAYSMVSGKVSPQAEAILEKSTNILMEDWLEASALLYPEAVKVIEKLNQEGIPSYDLTGIFYGMEDKAFIDSVHQADGMPKEMIAGKIHEILNTNHLLAEKN